MKDQIRLAAMATLLAPSAVVFLAPRVAMPPPPQSANASEGGGVGTVWDGGMMTGEALASTKSARLKNETRELLELCVELDGTIASNPFYYAVARDAMGSPYGDDPAALDPPAAGVVEPAPVELPQLAVTSIASSSSGAIAIVNGEVMAMGADVGDGWRIASIDPVGRSITIAHTSGREARIAQSR